MVLGEHALPVRSELAAPETRNTLPFSFVTWLIARATDEVGTSTITSTPSTSYHCRAIFDPTSGLLRWSAVTISILRPLWVLLQSSTARRAATAEPLPPMSEYRLDMSDITPILTTSPEICACAPDARANRPSANMLRWKCMVNSSFG